MRWLVDDAKTFEIDFLKTIFLLMQFMYVVVVADVVIFFVWWEVYTLCYTPTIPSSGCRYKLC